MHGTTVVPCISSITYNVPCMSPGGMHTYAYAYPVGTYGYAYPVGTHEYAYPEGTYAYA